MDNTHCCFIPVRSVNSSFLIPCVDLFERAFPAQERCSAADLLRIMETGYSSGGYPAEVVAILHGSQFAGLSVYELADDLGWGYIAYLAILPELRGKGIGSAVYRKMVDMAQRRGLAGLFLCPISPDGRGRAERACAKRRLTWLTRMGAKVLDGADRQRSAGEGESLVHHYILAHCLRDLSAEEVYFSAAALLDGTVHRSGELALVSYPSKSVHCLPTPRL